VKTTTTKPPRAGVDSGMLLVIDPCYLKQLLNLTSEQEAAWTARWLPIANDMEYLAGIHVAHNATAILVTCPDGDGIYSPEQVASFLTTKPEATP